MVKAAIGRPVLLLIIASIPLIWQYFIFPQRVTQDIRKLLLPSCARCRVIAKKYRSKLRQFTTVRITIICSNYCKVLRWKLRWIITLLARLHSAVPAKIELRKIDGPACNSRFSSFRDKNQRAACPLYVWVPRYCRKRLSVKYCTALTLNRSVFLNTNIRVRYSFFFSNHFLYYHVLIWTANFLCTKANKLDNGKLWRRKTILQLLISILRVLSRVIAVNNSVSNYRKEKKADIDFARQASGTLSSKQQDEM